MLGQLYLLSCVVAAASVAGILFVLFGPVPVKKTVIVVPRLVELSPTAAFAAPAGAQAPREQHFTPPQSLQSTHDMQSIAKPAHASPPPAPIVSKPKGGKAQPLPRKRAAKGTEAPSPFAPVVRSAHRQLREDLATAPVQVFDVEEMTTVEDGTEPRRRTLP